MRKRLILGCTLGIFAIAASTLLLSIDTNQFKSLIADRIKSKTGQTLTIQGALQWRFSYGLYLQAGETSLTSPAGYRDPYIIQAKSISLEVDLFSLLSKQLVINNLQLNGVTAVLEIAANGTSNWDALARDDLSAENNPYQQNTFSPDLPISSPVISQNTTPQKNTWDIVLRQITVNNSQLIWRKAANSVVFNQLNIALGNATHGVFPLQLSSSIALPRDTAAINYQGKLSLSENLNDISLTNNNLEITLINNTAEGGTENKITSTFLADLNRREGKVVLRDVRVDSPIAQVSGEVIAKTKPAPGFIDININSPYLDLDTLLPLWKDVVERADQPDNAVYLGQSGNTAISIEATSEIAELNSDNILDKSSDNTRKQNSLYYLDGFATLRVNKVHWRKHTFDDVSLDATIQQGIAAIDQFSMTGLGGLLQATGTVNLLTEPKIFEILPVLTHIQLSSLLNWLNSGIDARGVLNMSGKWLFEGWPNIDSSRGFVTLLLRDVDFEGVNLPYLLSSSIARAKGQSVASESVAYQTHLDKMAIDLNINQGKLKIARMNASANKLSLNATGNINLLTKQCDLTLNNRIQTANNDVPFVDVPLYVYGSLNDLRYRVDIVSIVKQQIRANKQKLRDKLEKQGILRRDEIDEINAL
ncbi:AsmA family protein [Plesiomonas sp.]|uniref:AsmA family protein n=1 Tax=Plesiomonas sp. TaxID=2486279 RepID=UPI003F361E1C